jgi:hypothetical protein
MGSTDVTVDGWRRVLHRVPGGFDLDLDEQIGHYGAIGRARHHLLRRAASAVRGDLEDYAIDLCETVGDVASFFESLPGAAPLPFSAVARGRLRPVLPSDYGWLYEAYLRPDAAGRNFNGRTPRPEEFQSILWANTSTMFIVAGKRDGKSHGIVSIVNDHAESGFCTLKAMRFTAGQPTTFGIVFDGLYLLVEHVFSTTPMRKIYFSVPEWLMPYVAGLDEVIVQEGLLRDFSWQGDRLWNAGQFALWRDSWLGFQQRWSNGSEETVAGDRHRVRDPDGTASSTRSAESSRSDAPSRILET